MCITDIGLVLDMAGVVLLGVVARKPRFRVSAFAGGTPAEPASYGSIIEQLTKTGQRHAVGPGLRILWPSRDRRRRVPAISRLRARPLDTLEAPDLEMAEGSDGPRRAPDRR